MFNNKRGAPSVPPLTVIGESARLEGKFNIAESIQIKGKVTGEINVGGRFVIGEKGIVRADVRTTDALIMGQYEGNMVATGTVEITATGRVSGNVETDSLVISKGGFFNGNVVKVQRGSEAVPERHSAGPTLLKPREQTKLANNQPNS